MVSTAERSTLPTIPGQRYVMTVSNQSGGDVTPFVQSYMPSGSDIIVYLTPENSTQQFIWGDGDVKHLTFIAWGHAIYFLSISPDILWDLRPIDG